MSRLIANTPIVEVLLRKEFLFDGERGYGEYEPGYIFGFCARPGRVPAFQVMLHCGAQWARVPIHMLCTRPCRPVSHEVATWWNCFSNDFEVADLELLKGLRCELRRRYLPPVEGNYLFTVDWQGSWADIPDQHKNHHIVAGADGNLYAHPNNKIRWLDESYLRPLPDDVKDWKRNTRSWSAEG